MTMRTKARGTAKAKADVLFSKLVRARDGHCMYPGCGATEMLDCAHLVSRQFSATRCEFDNAWTLCRKHHMHLTVEPYEHVVWATAMVGEARYKELRDLAYAGAKVDWEAVVLDLRERLKAVA